MEYDDVLLNRAYELMEKSLDLTKAKKPKKHADKIEHKIHILSRNHPDWEHKKVVAVAYKTAGERCH